jgi:mitotic spindle assembly checkpoint protein MAD2
MSSTLQATQSNITLKGSSQIVGEFFAFAINSILYQRGLYPPESFSKVQKYGLPMMVTNDEGLVKYLVTVTQQMEEWLLKKALQKLVLVITNVDTSETLERWCFNIETDDTVNSGTIREKQTNEINKEIQAIIRQITASVTFLPLLEGACTFDLLIYAKDLEVPRVWEESDPKFITNSSEVKLRSFTTSIHKVESMVSFKV